MDVGMEVGMNVGTDVGMDVGMGKGGWSHRPAVPTSSLKWQT